MKPYSQDLREKVMAAVAAGKQPNWQIAETFGISESTIEKWTRRERETGSVAASPHGGGTDRVLAAHGAFLRAVVKAQPDITLDELSERVAQELKLAVSPSMVSRELTRLHLPRKKRVSTTASARRRA
jgi:transposase